MNPASLPPIDPCDVLAIGPHPDDVEIGCGGTLLLLAAAKHTTSIVDLTRGEMGSRGTADERRAEADAAAKALGLQQRVNLGIPDTQVSANAAPTDLLVAVLRRARPRLLFAPLERDLHPDHTAAAQLVSRAFFLAGLKNHEPHLGAPHRPRLVLRFPGNVPVEPSVCVDISAVFEQKANVVRCYRSQLAPPDRSHLLQGIDVLERAQVRDRFFGTRIGVAAAEPFWHDGPLPLRDIGSLLPR